MKKPSGDYPPFDEENGNGTADALYRSISREPEISGQDENEPDCCTVLSSDAAIYPQRLRECLGCRAPRKLYCLGTVSLACRHGIVMLCGSRNASPEALQLAYRCSRMLVEQGVTVASGYARGIDMAAHRGALAGGGDTIAVLPYGIRRFRISGELQDVFEIEHFLAISELSPWCPFTVKGAHRRNLLLTAFASAVIVVEPGDTGGTWHSVRTASDLGKSLFFIEGQRTDFIGKLEEKNGSRIAVRNGTPDIQRIMECLAGQENL